MSDGPERLDVDPTVRVDHRPTPRPTLRARRSNRRWIIVAAVFAVIAAASTGALFLIELGIPSEELVTHREYLDAGRIADAEAQLQSWIDRDLVPVELEKEFREDIRAAREVVAGTALAEAREHFSAKRYADVIEPAKRVADLTKGVDALFMLAESLRLTDALAEAGPVYQKFIDSADGDGRTDDALFWCALSKRDAGDTVGARAMLERVVAIARSNFNKSARRELDALGP